MSLDNDLRSALRRVPAPEGFAGRVLARVRGGQTSGGQTILSAGQAGLPVLHWWRAAAATVLLAAVLGGWGAHEMVERRREAAGQRAREQVLLALRITGEKLAHAQRGVRNVTTRQ